MLGYYLPQFPLDKYISLFAAAGAVCLFFFSFSVFCEKGESGLEEAIEESGLEEVIENIAQHLRGVGQLQVFAERMGASSSPDTSPARSTQQDSAGSGGDSGGRNSRNSSSSSRVAGGLRRGSRVRAARERGHGGGIVSSPVLGLLAGARGRRGADRRAVVAAALAAAAEAERSQGRGRRGGGSGGGGSGGDGATSASGDDGDDDVDQGLLPNELRQLQREAGMHCMGR